MKILGGVILLAVAALVLAVEERLPALLPVATDESSRRPAPTPAGPSVQINVAGKADAPSGKRIVAIDVGHTRVSPGAISATGLPEYEFNLRIAEQVRAVLAKTQSVEPFVISSEKAMSLVARTKIAAARNAELFVSIHHDSAQDKYLKDWEVDGKKQQYADQFSGYGLFVSRKNAYFEESLAVAQAIGRAMSANKYKFARHHNEAVKGEDRPIIDEEAGIYAFDDLVVLKTAAMPAVLVECGVILNREEERSLLTPERQAGITAAIVRGVSGYLAKAPVLTRKARSLPLVESRSNVSREPESEASSESKPEGATPRKYPRPGTPLEPGPVRSSDRPAPARPPDGRQP